MVLEGPPLEARFEGLCILFYLFYFILGREVGEEGQRERES